MIRRYARRSASLILRPLVSPKTFESLHSTYGMPLAFRYGMSIQREMSSWPAVSTKTGAVESIVDFRNRNIPRNLRWMNVSFGILFRSSNSSSIPCGTCICHGIELEVMACVNTWTQRTWPSSRWIRVSAWTW